MAYVYRHIRLDKNIPFYIGIGNDNSFLRANDKKGRNKYWNNIVSKTQYEVEIIFDDIPWKEACKKEIEFISLYKRKKDGGTLCNITLGGDGKLGVVPANAYSKGHIPWAAGRKLPAEQIERQRLKMLGRPSWNKGISPSTETIQKQLQTKKERDVIYSGERHFMFGKKQPFEWREKSRLSRLGLTPWNKGKKWTSTELDKTKIRNAHDHRKIVIQQFTMDNIFVATFLSINDAARDTKISKGCISLCCQNKRKSAGNYIWKIKEGDLNPL